MMECGRMMRKISEESATNYCILFEKLSLFEKDIAIDSF